MTVAIEHLCLLWLEPRHMHAAQLSARSCRDCGWPTSTTGPRMSVMPCSACCSMTWCGMQMLDDPCDQAATAPSIADADMLHASPAPRHQSQGLQAGLLSQISDAALQVRPRAVSTGVDAPALSELERGAMPDVQVCTIPTSNAKKFIFWSNCWQPASQLAQDISTHVASP